MAGDYSRLTFDPRTDHAGVLMQQGRVQLDADWNELVAIFDRRWRAETLDLVGSCAVCHAIGAVSDTALPVLRPLLQFAGTKLDA